MFTEQRIRAFLYYLSVLVFFTGLPVILSSALGYKFDHRTFKFTKTGLIFLKTQPAGASIFFNNKLLEEKTPATLRELLPGDYNVKLELAECYPWTAQVRVEPGKVVILDKIILFPQRPNIKQISKERFNLCWLDEEKGQVYYFDYAQNSVYLSDLEGTRNEKIAALLTLEQAPAGWKVSPDREKLLYFNRHQAAVAYLQPEREGLARKAGFVIEHPQSSIREVFWHSDNYHFVVITNRSVEVMEAKANPPAVDLVRLNKADAQVFFNSREDVLYFVDSQKAGDGMTYDNLYKLELNTRLFPFLDMIKLKANE